MYKCHSILLVSGTADQLSYGQDYSLDKEEHKIYIDIYVHGFTNRSIKAKTGHDSREHL